MKTSEKATAFPKVVQKKIISAPRSEVFDAWTKPEILEKWLIPENGSAAATNDLRIGGRYEIDMVHTGPSLCDGTENTPGARLPHDGTYLEIKPPEKLVFTWNTSQVKNSRVTVELRDLGESTELTLTHEFLETEELRKGHARGWNVCLTNLEALLSQ